MKVIILTALFGMAACAGFSQNDKTITVNTLERPTAEMYKSVYMYPTFLEGKVVFKDESFAETKLNYNRITGQILFTRPKGDTLALARPETTSKVVIGADTFCFFQNAFLQKLSHRDDAPNVYVKQNMKYIGNEKKGPYGTYSQVSSANSNGTVSVDDQATRYISVDENLIYKSNSEFYLSDRFNNFFPANKARFYKMFAQHENQLRTFFETHKINFNKQEDLLSVLEYVQGLK
jgi:hypothetical protein